MSMLSSIPPFTLTDDQFAKVDAMRSNDAKTMQLQIFHQAHCYKHRQIVGARGSLDPRQFTLEWDARQGEFLGDAWATYLARCDAQVGEAA